MFKKLKPYIKYFILIIVLFFSYRFINSNIGLFARIKNLDFITFVYLSSLTVLGIWIDSIIFKKIILFFGIKLKFLEFFGLTILNRYSNYLFLKGGPIVRGAYLKKVHQLSYKKSFIVFIYYTLIQAFSIAFLAALSILIFFNETFLKNPIPFIVFSVLALISIAPFYFLPTKLFKIFGRKNKKVPDLIVLWNNIKDNKKLFFTSFLLFSLSIIIYSFKFYIIYFALFTPIYFPTTVMMISTGLLSSLASLTPGSIGIREAIISYTALFYGENIATAAAVASFDRVVMIICIFSLGFLFSFWYANRIKNNNIKNYENK